MHAKFIFIYSYFKVGKFGRSERGWWNAVRMLKNMQCHPFNIILEDSEKCLSPISIVSQASWRIHPVRNVGPSKQSVRHDPSGVWHLHSENSHCSTSIWCGYEPSYNTGWLSKLTNLLRTVEWVLIVRKGGYKCEVENLEWILWVWFRI